MKTMIKNYKILLLLSVLANIFTNAMEDTNISAKPKSLTSLCNDAINNCLVDKNKLKLLNFNALTNDARYLIKRKLIFDNVDKIWYNFSNDITKTALVGHKGCVNSIVISKDTDFIVSATNDNTACIWHTGNCTRLIGHTESVNTVAVSSDSSFVVTGSADGTACIWDTKTGQCLFTLIGHTNSINSVDISPDNTIIATGSNDNIARLWDAKTGKCITSLIGHGDIINAVGILENNIIVTTSNDGTICLWNVHGTCIKRLDGLVGVITNIFTYSKYFIAYGPYHLASYEYNSNTGAKNISNLPNRTIKLWDYAYSLILKNKMNVSIWPTCNTIIRLSTHNKLNFYTFKAHKSPITALKISSDGTFVVSGSESDNVIYVWSIRPIIEKLLSDDVSVEDLISILGLNKSKSNCIAS